MSELVVMPKSDWTGILDSVRAKTGKTVLMTSGGVAVMIDAIQTGGGDSKLVEVISKTVTEMTENDFGGATSIGTYAFYKCKHLTTVNTPDSVMTIGVSSFDDCTSLTSVNIPGVKEIKAKAFNGCSKLATVTFGGLITIYNEAFYGCSSLTNINLPDTLNRIETQAFQQCTSLTSVNIPDSVTTLGATSFYGCTGLTSVTIGKGVTKILGGTFQNCTAMQYYDFTSHTSVPTLGGTNAFTGIPSTCQIRVPASLYDAWISATNWSTYASNIVAV